MEEKRTYIAIDLKSFYASVECIDRHLDPMTANLVVADVDRTPRTICLAVSPSLKKYGIPGRPRLFQVIEKMKGINFARQQNTPHHTLNGFSFDAPFLEEHPSVSADFITAVPRMARYMEISSQIYKTYLEFVSPDDIHVYSIDEVMMDVTGYLKTYHLSPHELAKKMMLAVFQKTGVTATAGIGTNLYLCKVAMDIVAKHIPADRDGVRIAELDEISYRKSLWNHRPLTDFWRVGRGYAKKLEASGLYTMGDIARCSLGSPHGKYNEDLLYKLFGINAELLIDHAWGVEKCTMQEIKNYTPETNCMCAGQVLHDPYPHHKTRLVIREMAEEVALSLVSKNLVTNQVVLTVGYDVENLKNPELQKKYADAVTTDAYGRKIPKAAHGTFNFPAYTSSTKEITEGVLSLFDRIMDPALLSRRISLSANRLIPENQVKKEEAEQLTLFTDFETLEKERKEKEAALKKEKSMQKAMLDIKRRFGKNAILKGTNLEEGATAMERNGQIGGHKS